MERYDDATDSWHERRRRLQAARDEKDESVIAMLNAWHEQSSEAAKENDHQRWQRLQGQIIGAEMMLRHWAGAAVASHIISEAAIRRLKAKHT